MKKILSVLLVAVLLATVYFCFFDGYQPENKDGEKLREQIESNSSLYPVYSRLSQEEREVYLKICTGLRNFDAGIQDVYRCDSQSEANQFTRNLSNLYREIVYEQAELFWVNPYNFQVQTTKNGSGTYFIKILPEYLMDRETAEKLQTKFDRKLDKLVSGAKQKGDTFQKVLYVHDQLLSNCVYDQEAYEKGDFKTTSINAYGCLVEGKAICSGYTMAFTAAMRRLGYECGAEFNTYDSFTIFGEAHVWNYCKLDGDYYYFDLTWDDVSPNSDVAKYYDYCYSYFGVTTEELTEAHLTLSGKAPTPYCGGTRYNYFVYNGLSFDTYDYDAVKEALQSCKDEKYAAIRFGSYSQTLRAQGELLTDGKIFDILPDVEHVQYYISKSNHILYILFKE